MFVRMNGWDGIRVELGAVPSIGSFGRSACLRMRYGIGGEGAIEVVDGCALTELRVENGEVVGT